MLRAAVVTAVCLCMAGAAVSCGAAESQQLAEKTRVCPQKFEKLTNANARADEELAPTGASSVLICKFGGYGEGGSKVARTGRLVDQVRLRDGRSIDDLTQTLDQLPEFTGGRLCGLGSGVRYLSIFHFDEEADNVVLINRAGCELVSNGQKPTLYALERDLDRLLKRLFDV